MQSRQRATEQCLISKIDDIKEVAQKLGHPIVFFSSAYTKMCFLCWIIKPFSNEIISRIINRDKGENLENRDSDNSDKCYLVTDERKELVNALSELSKESNLQRMRSLLKSTELLKSLWTNNQCTATYGWPLNHI